jgi:replication factor C large subunit
MTLTWTEKYRPRKLSDIVGNKAAVKAFLDWIHGWEIGKPSKKAALLHGPPGVGKTSTVYAYAIERGLDVVEINASDYRTRERIENVIGMASQSATLSGLRNRIILVDEVDGVDSRADTGAVASLTKAISETRIPIVLVANDPWDPKLGPLRDKCEMIKFTRIQKPSIASHLKKIAEAEKLKVSDNLLRMIAEKSGGDLRSAINDLQALADSGGALSTETLGERERERDVFSAMATVFSARDIQTALTAFEGLDLEPADFFTWLLDNVPEWIKSPRDLANAMERLARADIHLQRVLATQRWDLLKYAIAIMTAGVSITARRTGGGGRLGFPSKIRYMGQTRAEREALASASSKIAGKCHLSSRKARTEMLPYIAFMIGRDKSTAKSLGGFFELSEGEMKYMAARYAMVSRKTGV